MTAATAIQRLPDRNFRFACHPALPCFTRCCTNLELILTTYDIIFGEMTFRIRERA